MIFLFTYFFQAGLLHCLFDACHMCSVWTCSHQWAERAANGRFPFIFCSRVFTDYLKPSRDLLAFSNRDFYLYWISLSCLSQCTSGFINEGDQLKVTCLSCHKSFCAQCKKPVSIIWNIFHCAWELSLILHLIKNKEEVSEVSTWNLETLPALQYRKHSNH